MLVSRAQQQPDTTQGAPGPCWPDAWRATASGRGGALQGASRRIWNLRVSVSRAVWAMTANCTRDASVRSLSVQPLHSRTGTAKTPTIFAKRGTSRTRPCKRVQVVNVDEPRMWAVRRCLECLPCPLLRYALPQSTDLRDQALRLPNCRAPTPHRSPPPSSRTCKRRIRRRAKAFSMITVSMQVAGGAGQENRRDPD